jgi:hypothetical protein
MQRRNSYDKVYLNLSGILDVSCDLKSGLITVLLVKAVPEMVQVDSRLTGDYAE